MANDTVKIKVRISTNKVGSECSNIIEFDREDWESMSEAEREEAMHDEVWNMAEWGWEVQGEGNAD